MQRVVMEALSNALQHSRASTLNVEARHDAHAGTVSIAIRDDGQGFEVERVGPGRGLRTMRTRAQHAGLRVSIDSAPGRGTCVTLQLVVAHPPGKPAATRDAVAS